MIYTDTEYQNSLYFCFHLRPEKYRGNIWVPGKILLIFCQSGNMQLKINGVQYTLDTCHMLFLHPHSQLDLLDYSPDFHSTCVGFMMGLQDTNNPMLDPGFFAFVLQTPCWQLNDMQKRAADGFCKVFDYVCNGLESTQKADMVSNIFTVFLTVFYENTKHLYKQVPENPSMSGRTLMNRFMRLLQINYKVDHRVSYYAERLCVSPKYLTQVVRGAIGVTPKDMIDRRIAMESLYQLSKTNKTIQEISLELGFLDQSYFGRFFKRLFHMSPLHFRQNPTLDLMKDIGFGTLELPGKYGDRVLLE